MSVRENPSPDRSQAAELPTEIFKAYDIRGIVGRTFTPTIVERIGHAIGSEARARKQNAVAVGRDGRLSGPSLVQALSRGLAAAGCDVTDIGMVPTPVLYFATHHLGTHSGVSVTGSHNPPDYNGLKIVLAGETLAAEAIQELRRRVLENDLVNGQGRISETDVREAYFDRVTADVKLARAMEVIVDCGNGVAGAVAPELLRRLGCNVEELYCEVDGHFPNHHPDPGQPKNLQDLIAAVKRRPVDLGIAFDGDGDRLGVVSPDGNIIWPDRQMILFARDVLSRHPGAEIVYDVKSSRALESVIREAGGKPVIWKTGHSFIKAKLRESDKALLAGEMSGHVFFKERWYGFDDAIYGAARLLELVSRDERAPAEIFAALPDTVNTPELHLQMAEGEHHAFIKELVKQASFADAKVTTIDGLRADFDDGFGLVRASNTQPVLVFRFEGTTQAALKRIQDQFRALITGLRADLTLPF
ncbi:MAG: phosphomannomutase/phosphoglucomutase [Acidiferrobacterales bacterium]